MERKGEELNEGSGKVTQENSHVKLIFSLKLMHITVLLALHFTHRL